MKKFKLLFAVAFVCVLAFSAFGQTEKDVFGYYYIQNPPKAFADISEIHLAGDYGAQQVPVTYGLIRLKDKNAKDFEIVSVEIKGKNITFMASKNGAEGFDSKTQEAIIDYVFVGTFLKFPNNTEQTGTVLQGTLMKVRGKRTIAEARVRFSYEKGD